MGVDGVGSAELETDKGEVDYGELSCYVQETGLR